MKDIYKNHALCVREGCEMADCCLRSIAYREVEDSDKEFPIVNPHLTTGTAECQYIARLKEVRFARGFKTVLTQIPVADANNIYHALMSHFGKNQYYDRRNGKLLLSPGEQAYIKDVFQSFHVTAEIFDGYEDKDVWDE